MRATRARWPHGPIALVLLAGLLVGLTAQDASAQRMRRAYDVGQEVVPAYEGWEQNPDGSFNLVFGTMNRNWEEELHIPIGSGNHIEPGGARPGTAYLVPAAAEPVPVPDPGPGGLRRPGAVCGR